MLPKRNEKDLQDVPEEARRKLQFVPLETVDDAVKTALLVEKTAPKPEALLAD
jgi:ATP-dependent Lon protease